MGVGVDWRRAGTTTEQTNGQNDAKNGDGSKEMETMLMEKIILEKRVNGDLTMATESTVGVMVSGTTITVYLNYL